MSPARKEPDISTYSGRIAKRMQRLRLDAEKSVQEVIVSMEKNGYSIGEPAYRHWENGTRPQHVNALPAIAKALGVKLEELLPKK